jgi:hypothetical protein
MNNCTNSILFSLLAKLYALHFFCMTLNRSSEAKILSLLPILRGNIQSNTITYVYFCKIFLDTIYKIEEISFCT